MEDDPDALKSAFWLETDKKYKTAMERLIQVKAQKAVKVKEEDESADFSRESPEKYISPIFQIMVDKAKWEKKLKEYSKLFNDFPKIYESSVSLSANATNKYLVNSEGTVIQHGLTHWRLGVYARTKAEDGMDLYKYESFEAHSMEKMPDEEEVHQKIKLLKRTTSSAYISSCRAVYRPSRFVRARCRCLFPRDFRPPRRGPSPEG